jgi:hypothetical protein
MMKQIRHKSVVDLMAWLVVEMGRSLPWYFGTGP